MKTYTITWRHQPYYGSTFSRFRFWPVDTCSFIGDCVFLLSAKTPIDLLLRDCHWHNCDGVRFITCGKLVARKATYQGV